MGKKDRNKSKNSEQKKDKDSESRNPPTTKGQDGPRKGLNTTTTTAVGRQKPDPDQSSSSAKPNDGFSKADNLPVGKDQVPQEKLQSHVQADSEQLDEVEQNFSRRKISTNWNRYDETPADPIEGEDYSRGYDFDLLLNAPGGIGAYFRFKDEKLWEEETSSSLSELLSLDCQDLSAAVNCVPLHQMLMISENLFSAKLLSKISDKAKKNSQNYVPLKKVDDETKIQNEAIRKSINSKLLEKLQGIDTEVKVGLDSEIKMRVVVDAKLKPVLEISSPWPEEGESDTNTLLEGNVIASGSNESILEDIGHDNVLISNKITSPQTELLQTNAAEDDLEMLLTLEKPLDISGKSAMKDSATHKHEDENKERPKEDLRLFKEPLVENLEAFLDSILDE